MTTRLRLRTLLSSSASVLRPTLFPNPNLPIHITTKPLSPSPPTYSDNYTFFPTQGLDFLGNHRLSGKIFLSSQSAPEVNNSKCWNCNTTAEVAPFLVCSSCRCIQPVDESVNFFQIFGL